MSEERQDGVTAGSNAGDATPAAVTLETKIGDAKPADVTQEKKVEETANGKKPGPVTRYIIKQVTDVGGPLFIFGIAAFAGLVAAIGGISYSSYIGPALHERIAERRVQQQVQAVKGFQFNWEYYFKRKPEYAKERDALSVFTEPPKAATSIDSLFHNTIALGGLFVPSIDTKGLDAKLAHPLREGYRYNMYLGNGLLISSEGHIITARHVVEALQSYALYKMFVVDEAKRIHPVTAVLAYDRKSDLALLASDYRVKDRHPILTVSEAELKSGQIVTNLGRVVDWEAGILDIDQGVIRIIKPDKFKIGRYTSTGWFQEAEQIFVGPRGYFVVPAFRTSSFAQGGASGSPVTYGGRVAGIVSHGGENATIVSPASSILKLVHQYLTTLREQEQRSK